MRMSAEFAFNIQTLLAASQPQSILVLGHDGEALVSDYVQQKAFLQQPCRVQVLVDNDLLAFLEKVEGFDTGVIINVIQFMDKKIAGQLIAKLRNVHTLQFCLLVLIGAG